MMHAAARRPAFAAWLLPVLWLGLTIALVFVLRTLPLDRAIADLRRVHAMWLGAAIVANFIILPLWAIEWRVLVPGATRVRYGRMFEVVAWASVRRNS